MPYNMKITKEKIEVYKIRGLKGGAWADITLDRGESSGRLQIASDYGNWSYYWGSCGESFNKFLCSLDIHYTAGKFGESDWFDHNATISNLVNRIDEYSEDYPDLKSVLLEELDNLKSAYDKDEFTHSMWNCDNILHMEGHQPDLIKDITPSFNQFWDKIWLGFVEHLKKEDE